MTPQHLQWQDRYHEDLLAMRLGAVSAYGWGLRKLELDDRAATTGFVRITRAEGLLPDGTPFRIGERADSVEPKPIEASFPPSMQELDVFLALASVKEHTANVSSEGKPGPMVRYGLESDTAGDWTNGKSEAPVTWARPNLRILFGTEPRDAFETIRIAKLVRDPAGAFAYKRAFIPSFTSLRASEVLLVGLRKIHSLMLARQKDIRESRRMRNDASVDFQASDAAKFWLLHTFNAELPVLQHHIEQQSLHAEQVYLYLCRLGGQLCTFSPTGDPTEFPAFNYLELETVLGGMVEQVQRLLTTVLTEDFFVVTMEKREDGMYLGKFDGPQVPRDNAFYIEASGADEATLRDRLPKLLKIGSWTQISYILNAAMPGVRTVVEYRPPGSIPVKPGLVYLKVEGAGDYWNNVISSGTIAIYQPIDPQKVQLRLIGIPSKG